MSNGPPTMSTMVTKLQGTVDSITKELGNINTRLESLTGQLNQLEERRRFGDSESAGQVALVAQQVSQLRSTVTDLKSEQQKLTTVSENLIRLSSALKNFEDTVSRVERDRIIDRDTLRGDIVGGLDKISSEVTSLKDAVHVNQEAIDNHLEDHKLVTAEKRGVYKTGTVAIKIFTALGGLGGATWLLDLWGVINAAN